MNIYLLEQNVNNGYDTYDSVVVVALSAKKAKLIRPDSDKWGEYPDKMFMHEWAFKPEQVKVTYLGKASSGFKKEGVILGSYNAG